MPAASAAVPARLKREDCPRTKHNSRFSPWKVLVGPSDWEDHAAGKEGVQRYRVLNLPENFPGLYDLGVARASDEGIRARRNDPVPSSSCTSVRPTTSGRGSSNTAGQDRTWTPGTRCPLPVKPRRILRRRGMGCPGSVRQRLLHGISMCSDG